MSGKFIFENLQKACLWLDEECRRLFYKKEEGLLIVPKYIAVEEAKKFLFINMPPFPEISHEKFQYMGLNGITVSCCGAGPIAKIIFIINQNFISPYELWINRDGINPFNLGENI